MNPDTAHRVFKHLELLIFIAKTDKIFLSAFLLHKRANYKYIKKANTIWEYRWKSSLDLKKPLESLIVWISDDFIAKTIQGKRYHLNICLWSEVYLSELKLTIFEMRYVNKYVGISKNCELKSFCLDSFIITFTVLHFFIWKEDKIMSIKISDDWLLLSIHLKKKIFIYHLHPLPLRPLHHFRIQMMHLLLNQTTPIQNLVLKYREILWR